ncbi:MAG: hypothetical protein J7M40_03770 [Planctomycetes bacterium]|nr:hypothetical protein [Planctomycetota bacterium]
MTCQTVNAIYVVLRHVRRQSPQSRDRDADGVIEGWIIDMAAARCAGTVDVSGELRGGRLLEHGCPPSRTRGMAGLARQVEMMKPDTAVRTILIAGKRGGALP